MLLLKIRHKSIIESYKYRVGGVA